MFENLVEAYNTIKLLEQPNLIESVRALSALGELIDKLPYIFCKREGVITNELYASQRHRIKYAMYVQFEHFLENGTVNKAEIYKEPNVPYWYIKLETEKKLPQHIICQKMKDVLELAEALHSRHIYAYDIRIELGVLLENEKTRLESILKYQNLASGVMNEASIMFWCKNCNKETMKAGKINSVFIHNGNKEICNFCGCSTCDGFKEVKVYLLSEFEVGNELSEAKAIIEEKFDNSEGEKINQI